MDKFIQVFNNAMELSCLGLYEKIEDESELREYKESLLLKKALDKFSMLNITYSLFDEKGEWILPSDEATLINVFNFPIRNLIDKLPKEYQGLLNRSDWYCEENYINIGKDNCYYCTSELLDKLNDDRIYRKAKKSPYKELELESQRFIELLFDRTQEEYCEIRSFLEQKDHTFITNSMYVEKDNIRDFKNKYPKIFDAAYQKLNYDTVNLKICPHCGLVLNEMSDGTLYCVSDRCAEKTKGFITYNETKINEDRVWVLKQNVSRYIYYPGILEQEIKSILEKAKIHPKLWIDKDTWDFLFHFQGKTWVIDAKDTKSPRAIQNDIIMKQKKDIPYDKVLYIIPSYKKKNYLEAIRRVIKNNKIQCITLADFKRLMNESQKVYEKCN